jgi:crotonobetainyl-CoA:carnitine CoA-transferase CaiB-like acyl-CoA transferase
MVGRHPRAQHLGVDVGKYDAYLDLRSSKDLGTMRQLAATVDVVASAYRPAVNQRSGLLPEPLAAASERGADPAAWPSTC